ncbi:hypothetical protein FOZ74_14955 [Comamonas flocculans]|uniref:Uncharacterized protein n=1 Tax=Comamonas flocculans TaxID=2597701 RepID=A0A5B8RZN4_9BURK|nr:hypothetical protein FOZ74_14955 [Comamonas flocculans]
MSSADTQGRAQRAYFARDDQDWTAVTWTPCSALDPTCMPALGWLLGAVLVLLVSAAWAMVRAALAMDRGAEERAVQRTAPPVAPRGPPDASVSWQDRMLVESPQVSRRLRG